MLLYGVYVCKSLLYGCAVWGSCLLVGSGDLQWDCTWKFGSSHRSALRAILGEGNDVKNEIVYVLVAEWPLQLQIAKQVFHFVHGFNVYKRLMTQASEW